MPSRTKAVRKHDERRLQASNAERMNALPRSWGRPRVITQQLRHSTPPVSCMLAPVLLMPRFKRSKERRRSRLDPTYTATANAPAKTVPTVLYSVNVVQNHYSRQPTHHRSAQVKNKIRSPVSKSRHYCQLRRSKLSLLSN